MCPTEGSAGATGVGVCILVIFNRAKEQCYCNVFYADVPCTPDLNNVLKEAAARVYTPTHTIPTLFCNPLSAAQVFSPQQGRISG